MNLQSNFLKAPSKCRFYFVLLLSNMWSFPWCPRHHPGCIHFTVFSAYQEERKEVWSCGQKSSLRTQRSSLTSSWMPETSHQTSPSLWTGERRSLTWSVLLPLSYVFHTSLFRLNLLLWHTANETSLRRPRWESASAGFREPIPGISASPDATLLWKEKSQEELIFACPQNARWLRDCSLCTHMQSSGQGGTFWGKEECGFLGCFFCFVLFFVFLPFLGSLPTAYGGSQARGLIRAAAAGPCHSHSNMGS